MTQVVDSEYDIIVVGAGSAGCALAYRLARQSRLEVLLVEAGSAARNPLLHIPLGFAFLLKPHRNNWAYRTEPESQLGQGPIDLPRGKVLGGCSAINGMVYVRGQARDYDDWAAAGNPGWHFNDLLPYFIRAESHPGGDRAFHGDDGPLWVAPAVNEFAICDAFIRACQQMGHPLNDDFNGAQQEGVGYFACNIRHGRRISSASAYLGAGRQLPNLSVLCDTEARRILFDKQRATGLEVISAGRAYTLGARREVVLCGGAINSPKLLELSGIGDASRLRKLGIETRQHLPGVGENLHDHWNAYIKRSLISGRSYYDESRPLRMLYNLFRYLISGRGFIANPAAMIAVFYKALANASRPDAQIHFAPAASQADSRGNLLPINAITLASCGLRPSSRGYCHIDSADHRQAPRIRLNYLTTEQDQLISVAAFREARAICAADALQAFVGPELEPGDGIHSDTDILNYIRRSGEPVHHLAGSCRMGPDEDAVVDAQLRVRGIDALRVADASIMPTIVSGNTHAACVMIGEKGADLILSST